MSAPYNRNDRTDGNHEAATAQWMRLIARGLAAGRLKTTAHGVENIPEIGPALIVARHYHHLFDGLALFASVPRPFHVLVSLDWIQNPLMRLLMKQITGLARWPVVLRSESLTRARDNGRRQTHFSVADVTRYRRQALRDSVRLVVEGRLLVIFPEGYPNIDPRYTPKRDSEEFLPFKAGFVTIARAAEKHLSEPLSLVPAGLRYSGKNPCLAQVRFGKAVGRNHFNSSAELVAYFEKQVKELSR